MNTEDKTLWSETSFDIDFGKSGLSVRFAHAVVSFMLVGFPWLGKGLV